MMEKNFKVEKYEDEGEEFDTENDDKFDAKIIL
jgi:hypothetical protein